MTEINARLRLSRQEMRRLGYAVVDALVDYHDAREKWDVSRVPSRADLAEKLSESIPMTGSDPLSVLRRFERDIAPNISHVDHPQFYAFVPGPGNFVGAMAETLAAGFNVFAGTWLGGAAAAETELVVIEWLKEICGLPPSFGGLFVSGGSVANLTALATARHHLLGESFSKGVAYCSDQTHSAVDRAFRILGFPSGSLRRLPVDDRFRLDMAALEEATAADLANGMKPFCVIGNAGTTNTGAVDPLDEMASFCSARDLWFHVDGAYGASAAICERGRKVLTGLEKADSIALDPHKWLFQPFETGCVLVRNPVLLRETFRILPEYMQDTVRESDEVNFCDYGVQLSRSFRALKVWMSFQVFGRDAFEAAVEHGFEMAEYAEESILRREDWVIASAATMGILSFRYAPPGIAPGDQDRITLEASRRLHASGKAMVSTTTLKGRSVIRMCPINPSTTRDGIDRTIDQLEDIARGLRRR